MGRIRTTILVILGVTGTAAVSAGQPVGGSGGFKELQRAPLPNSTSVEIVMGLVERNSESTSGKHLHPGGELGYVLGGSVVVRTQAGSVETLQAGDSFYQPPNEWHVVDSGVSGTKTIVFRVVEKGQPMVVPVE
jgi:quercetin dioxygenase-like cupin family protein